MSRTDRIRLVGVVVPAHNERLRIAACLASLRAARRHLVDHCERPPVVRIIVALDACDDGTADLVAQHSDVEAVTVHARQVGVARRAGSARLLHTAGVPMSQMWLANTDADTRVPTRWLTSMLQAADNGADLVLGTALPADPLPPRVATAWARRHVLRDGHPHVHGANLGIRADAYLALGGWTAVSCDEDVALVERARTAGHLRIVRTAHIPVSTSSRLSGRAPHGFAACLAALQDAG